ncbi:ParA family protein [Micromonospora yangpuensis]|uniref:Chromosome partitioning protein n=1 Tax=Micromonospora yangpuensis TaxID=683228 RepID=A0A1C6U9Z7_9ACTN|nr:ParA family protein [Micromonospora yangpuensis]GGL88195.1 cobyrinic acid a,c-diamide synthase [Micromonospora yangpuensis]SCL50743.1 chromosome partitioning protein [Micromonospora yangpuensis]
MSITSVINYKGGVGKTTITANLGAELAARGRRVLLIDLDPQASLTFSFYPAAQWEAELAYERTVLQWFGSVLADEPTAALHPYVLTPEPANALLPGAGRLDLIASHLQLVDVDLDLAAALGGSRFQHGSPHFLPLHRALADALATEAFAGYDDILIDCAPNFTMVTRTAIVASEHILTPAKPDYLSTLGIDYLRSKVSELVSDFNRVATPGPTIDPQYLGVVFTMIQYAGSAPISASRNYLRLTDNLEVPVFRQTIRENKTLFGTAGERHLPAVLVPNANDKVQYELQQLASEFLARTRA